MPNEILWILFMLVDLFLALVFFRLFGKTGLYAISIISIIVCNLQVMKLVELFGITATLGNILYASIFFSTDVLGEIYGPREAKRGGLARFRGLAGNDGLYAKSPWLIPPLFTGGVK